jgi:hypothetical protein
MSGTERRMLERTSNRDIRRPYLPDKEETIQFRRLAVLVECRVSGHGAFVFKWQQLL